MTVWIRLTCLTHSTLILNIIFMQEVFFFFFSMNYRSVGVAFINVAIFINFSRSSTTLKKKKKENEDFQFFFPYKQAIPPSPCLTTFCKRVLKISRNEEMFNLSLATDQKRTWPSENFNLRVLT